MRLSFNTLLSSVALLPALLPAVEALLNTTEISRPAVSFEDLGGQIVALGDYDGISFYNYANASAFLLADSYGVYLRNTTSGAARQIATVEGGAVSLLLKLSDDSVLLLGSYTALNGEEYLAPTVLNVTSGLFSLLLSSGSARKRDLEGQVLTAYLDDDLLYLGGNFTYNDSVGAAVYNVSASSMAQLPFQGFGDNATVSAITKIASSSGGSILYAGDFDTLGLAALLSHNITITELASNSSNSTNSTIISAEQVVLLKHGTFASSNGASSNDNSAVICPGSSTWAALDNEGSLWSVALPQGMAAVYPTKVRIYVPSGASDGIETFRIYSYPGGGIMNLTYVNPETNALSYCDASCPLLLLSSLTSYTEDNIDSADNYSDDDTVYINSDGSLAMYYDASTKSKNLGYGANYQEYAFVNTVPVDMLALTSIAWYGSRGEFSGFEVYSNSITVYGNDTLNDSNCGLESDVESNVAVINSGTWQSVLALSDSVTDTDYLVCEVDSSAEITLYPNISYSGYYSLLLYTPGCSQDGSCDVRAKVNVTVLDEDDTVLNTQIIFQNNENEKFDYLYYGHFNGTSSMSSRSKVVILYDSAISEGTLTPWVVVDRVVANIVSLDDYNTTSTSNSSNSTNSTSYMITEVKINGFFEYSLANFTDFEESDVSESVNGQTVIKSTNNFVGNSSINELSGKLARGSSVSDMILTNNNDLLVLLGDFSSSSLNLSNNNILTILISGYNTTSESTEASLQSKRHVKRDLFTLNSATFNDSISSIVSLGDGYLALGAFSMTLEDGVESLANNSEANTAYNFALYSGSQWYSFGNSYFAVDFTHFADVTIDDTEYYIFSSALGDYEIWDNTDKSWYTGNAKLEITSAVSFDSTDQQILSGESFGEMQLYGTDQAYFTNESSIESLGLDGQNGSVLTSFYYNSTFSLIGGLFTAENSIVNVAVVSDDKVSALNSSIEWDNDTAVSALYIDADNEVLYIGSNGLLSIGDLLLAGLAIYSLSNGTFSNIQPAALSNSEGNLSVNALALYNEGNRLLVGGAFTSAGSLGCESVCLYDVDNTRWISPLGLSLDTGLKGTVTDAKFVTAQEILLSGDLTLGLESLNFAVYDFKSQAFAATPSDFNNTGVSGVIGKFIFNDQPSDSLNKRMVAAGSDFIIGYDGSSWSRIDSTLDLTADTVITDLKLISLSGSNSENSDEKYFASKNALLISGNITLPDYGVVNSAMYDGLSWIPYLFTLQNSTYGIINSLLFEDLYKALASSDVSSEKSHLTTGQVVGISLACALGSTALLGLLFIIPVLYLSRQSQKQDRVSRRIYEDDMMNAVNPEDLFHEMDAQRVQ